MNSSFSAQMANNTALNHRDVVSFECWNKYAACWIVAPCAQIYKKINSCSSTVMLLVGDNNPRQITWLDISLNVPSSILNKSWITRGWPLSISFTRICPVNTELCIGTGSVRMLLRHVRYAKTDIAAITRSLRWQWRPRRLFTLSRWCAEPRSFMLFFPGSTKLGLQFLLHSRK